MANKFIYKTQSLDTINKPVDTAIWKMALFEINAYYHPTRNEIVFPAAILQPPFFFPPTPGNPYGEPDVNLGAIGALISPEISHGYDDSGRQFDQMVKLRIGGQKTIHKSLMTARR
jgi:putative endopeptidase